jgi:catechol 2,3-dioxygenase-like lactoylglutathione lyase family enzyme
MTHLPTNALAAVSLLVREYDEAIEFFTRALGFELIEDTPLDRGKRWVVVAPRGAAGARLLLARAATEAQRPREEPYGRVAVFLDLYGNKWDLVEPKGDQSGRSIDQ